MDEVGEFQGIADEEYRGVVADNVPIAFLGIEAQRETAHVALGIRGTTLAGDGGETQERFGLLADLRECRDAGVFADVVGDRQRPVGGRTLGMDGAFWNALAV